MNILNFNNNNNIFNPNTIHYTNKTIFDINTLIIIKIKIFITKIILFLIVILLMIIKIKIFKIFHQDPIELGHAISIELSIRWRTQDNWVLPQTQDNQALCPEPCATWRLGGSIARGRPKHHLTFGS